MTIAPILKALSNPVRLELLRMLQEPKSLNEIRLMPERKEGGEAPKRPMNRVTVRHHLEQLLDIGAVTKIGGFRDGRPTDLYVVAAEQMFLLGQELMAVGRVQVEQRDLEVTREMHAESQHVGQVGLALVNGLYEGKWFPLRQHTREGDAWTIGREATHSVALTFDPFVSGLHAEIHQDGDQFLIRPAPNATNPLYVDWEKIGANEERKLQPGSVITMGRSTLVFRSQ